VTSDPVRAFAMGMAGREKMERDYSPASHLGRIEALYAEATGSATRRARSR